MSKKILIIFGLGVVATGAIWYFIRPAPVAGALDGFAQCLAEKQITMYGAEWCPHCQNEKRAFGESFQYVPYVECPDNPRLCLEKGIQGYPTWIFPDGTKRLEGEQGLERLSQESGCILGKRSSGGSQYSKSQHRADKRISGQK